MASNPPMQSCSRIWRTMLVLVALALGGSVWAWAFSAASCSSCGAASALVGGADLAPAGVAFYAALLVGGTLFGPSRFFFYSLSIAAAVHFVLIGLLMENGVFCAPCVLTGAAAIAAEVVALVSGRANLARASIAFPLAGVLTLVGLQVLGVRAAVEEARAASQRIKAVSASEPPVSEARASLVAYVKEGCHYCEELEREVLPLLRREFGADLFIATNPAPDGIPTPTIVVTGASRTVFPGLPPYGRLRAAVEGAIGRTHP